MRWLLVLLAGLVALFVVVAIVGAMLPQEHVASRNVRFNQPPEIVWQSISNFAATPSWRSDLASVQQLPDIDGHPVWRETYEDGSALTLETLESEPRRRLVRRIVDTDLQFGGHWSFEIVPSNGGSILTITEHGEIYNPIFRFFSRFIIGHRATIDEYLKALGNKFGEEVHLGG
jgi:hypothetical protein